MTDATYELVRPATERELLDAATLIERYRQQQAVLPLVQELWGENASQVRYLRIQCTTHYNDEYYDPTYVVVGLRDGANTDYVYGKYLLGSPKDYQTDGEWDEDEYGSAYDATVELASGARYLGNDSSWNGPVTSDEAKRVVEAVGLDWLGDEQFYDGEGDPEQELVIDLRADIILPVLYVRA